jgi:hypothetical protein
MEEYIKLLESFKQNQLSKLIERIDTKIFDVLYSKHVSTRITPFFPRYELCFMSDETVLVAGKVYIREKNGKIAYSVITPTGELIKDAMLAELDAPVPFKYKLATLSDGEKPEPGTFYTRIQNKGLEYSVVDPQGKLVTALIKKEDLITYVGSDLAGLSAQDLEPFMPAILKLTASKGHTLPFTLDAFRARVLSATSRPIPFKYKLASLSATEKPEPGLFYAQVRDTGLEYSVVDPQGKWVKALIKKEELKIHVGSELAGLSVQDLEPFMPAILKFTASKGHTFEAFRAPVLPGHTQWAPFTNYSLDPDNISQIKKLLNILYYARLTFLDLEHVDVRNNKFSHLKFLYDKTVNLAYEASYLATHLDVDLRDIFNEELALLLPILSQIQNFAEKHTQQKDSLVKAIQPIPLAYKVGEVTGIAIDQMQPIGGDVDYNFLTKFSAVLPNYIHKLTQSIQEYSSQIKKNEPNLNKKKLDELQNAALSLLNEIENLKGNSVFVSLKFLNYIHIIQDVITLSTSSLEQIGELTEKSQGLVRDKLAQLKYVVFPTLFGLVDKIEDNAMLKPGTLSAPLMKNVKALYSALLYLPQKAIDFEKNGAELLVIEDSHFIECRLEMAYKRIDKANKALYKARKVQDACEKFFTILNSPLYNNKCLYQLPPEIKKELIKHYKLLQPYMIKLDIDLNALIIDRLKSSEKESWTSYLGRPLRWLGQDAVSVVLAKQKALEDLITKDEKSHVFHINLNKDLIDSVTEHADLELFPYNKKTNVYALDESIPLQIEREQEKKLKLSKAEMKRVTDAYSRFAQIINEQITTKPILYTTNLYLNKLDDKAKAECRTLYKIFQPYLDFFVIDPALKESTKSFDQYLDKIFTNKPAVISNAPPTQLFLKLDKDIQKFFTHIHFELLDKADFKNIFDAYTSFSQLLNNHIKEKPQLFGTHLALNNLDASIGRELHLMSELPKSLAQYKNSYIFIKKNDTRELYYIKSDEKYGKAKIIDFNLFEEKINAIKKKDETKLHLNEEQIQEIVTSNGGHNPSIKEECCNLYKTFQPYLSLIIPSEFKEATENFETYLNKFLTNQPLDILKSPTTSMFLQLDKKALEFFNKWQDKSNSYYDFAKDKLLSEQESNALRLKREKDDKLLFNIIAGNKLLKNTNQLSADEALELSQWYENKNGKFQDAQNAYTRFIELLKKQIAANPKIQDNIVLLKNLDPTIKNEFRNLYNLFQPYFINAVPPEKRKNALMFDKYIVAILSNREISAKKTPTKDESPVKTLLDNPLSAQIFLDMDDAIRGYFTTIEYDWRGKNQAFSALAAKKFTLENEAAEFTLDPSIGKRAHYIIPHTNYSKSVHKFRTALFAVTKLFNKAMQEELTPGASGVPFPEMEDDNQRLMQSKNLCALKDIFNSMYHLEGIALALEELQNKDYKTRYVSHLLSAYGHINEIIKLSKRLYADPHLGFIARELLDKAQTLYATFMEHSDAYQTSPEQVGHVGQETVKYNPLWYVLNAFYISPKHIRALKNTNYLTTEELNELHLHAKTATLYIEGLINSSDSYVKLFLQAPSMVYLYQELTKKLNEFTSTSHDTAVNNLNKIRSTAITPMLLEADRWESKLGLSPGSLSGPLRQITDEFFKGLLHPLGLSSATYIALICDKKPLEERTTLTKKQIVNSQKYLKRIEKEYKDIAELYQAYTVYRTPFEIWSPPSDEELQKIKEELHRAYRKALPKLTKLKLDKRVEISPSQYPEDHKLDALCNLGLKEYDPHHTEIEALIKASHHYYLGLKATNQIGLKTAEEKLNYLTKLSKTQETEQLTFIEKYTIESFNKHLKLFCNRHIGLQYTDKEYQKNLKEYLLIFRNEIITKSKKAADIDLSIKKLLKENISTFERANYVDYYHLDKVRVALAQFKIYFSYSTEAIENKSSLFENKDTLAKKTAIIDELDAIARNGEVDDTDELDGTIARNDELNTIARNKKLSAKERWQQIKEKIETDSSITRTITAHKHMETFSFNYLAVCFLSLLEALHLYTPTRKKLLNNLNNALNETPKISELTNRFGLFATTVKDSDAAKQYEPPTLPITALAL